MAPAKFLRALFLSVLLIGPASAADYVAGPSGGSNLPGTRTNDNACVGCVGEVMQISVPGTTSTVTITLAAPGIISWAAHGLTAGTSINFTTSGALPTGLAISTNYYVCAGSTLLAGSFAVATTVANAFAGTCITTSVSQSGTQNAFASAFLTTATQANIGALNLTAGDWNCWGLANFLPNGSTTVSALTAGLSTTSAVLPSAAAASGAYISLNLAFTTGAQNIIPVGAARLSLSATTPLYLIANGAFAVSTMLAQGNLICRRAR